MPRADIWCLRQLHRSDYHPLFQEATTSDGVYADMVADKLGNAFDNDPSAFIKALSNQTDEEIKYVSDLTVYSHYFDDFESFKKEIATIKDSNCSDGELIVIDAFQSYINKLENPPASDEFVEPIEAAAFNQEVIKSFIELNISLGNAAA